MGFGFFSSLMILMMLFRFSLSQQPNTDGFFLSVFLKKMGFLSSETYNFSSPVCSWERVFCDSQQVNVIGLMGSGLGLSGFIPDNTIGKLKMLQSLDLSNNKITGFSSDFWSLGSNLKTLNLSYNQISGVLPNDIGNFGILETLDLSFNNFSGIIPESFSSLLSLQILKLNQNWFNGGIPTLNCQNLVSIDISSNRLTEFVPEGFGTTIPKLKTLNLAENEIRGSSSDFLGLKFITHLNISGNNFHGSIMDIFMEHLEVIDLSRNRFQGFISHLNSSFNWSTLVLLDLSENELSGEFFDAFDIAYNLKHLNLAHNKFSNQKFPPIEMVPNLEYLNLSQTSIIGEIPTEISHLISLVSLDLSGNWLTGRIPYLGTQNLQVLDLSMNNLTGQIPLSLLRKLLQVERFNFSYNNLTFCDSQLSPETIKTSFIGSLNSCPIAANPDFFRRKTTKHNNFKLVLAITIAIVCFFGGLVCLVIGFRRRTKMLEATDISCKEERNISGPFSFKTDSTTWVADVKVATAVPLVIFEKPLLNYTFADLLSATSHFNQETLMAEGRFGPVYRGFLPGGFHVAVKVLVHVSTMTDEEVARELEYLGRVRHPNLVPLTGYCLAGDQRIAIYDYMENGNLQNLLHDDHPVRALELTEDSITDKCEEVGENSDGIQNVGSESLLKSWRFRHRIALGIARALAFLHHGCCPPIIHRDVKASSIYIDSNFEPRLSDFGLINGQEDGTPHGTPGYTAPESLEQENDSSTLKSDVYGFGVVLFELITGKSPVGDDYSEEKESNLVSWVRGLVRKHQSLKAVDPEILERGGSLETQMEEALKIGYLCTADLPTKRPSMHQIVGLLKDIEPILNQG